MEVMFFLQVLSFRLNTRYQQTFKINDLTNSDAPDHVLPGTNPATEFMCESVNNAWEKLQEYYTLVDRSVWYLVGLVLNPEQKWAHYEYAWG
jgi:hypothetical protein